MMNNVKWTITIETTTRDEDSLILQVLKRIAQLGLKYTVVSKSMSKP